MSVHGGAWPALHARTATPPAHSRVPGVRLGHALGVKVPDHDAALGSASCMRRDSKVRGRLRHAHGRLSAHGRATLQYTPASSVPRRLNATDVAVPCSKYSSMISGSSTAWNGSARATRAAHAAPVYHSMRGRWERACACRVVPPWVEQPCEPMQRPCMAHPAVGGSWIHTAAAAALRSMTRRSIRRFGCGEIACGKNTRKNNSVQEMLYRGGMLRAL